MAHTLLSAVIPQCPTPCFRDKKITVMQLKQLLVMAQYDDH